MCDTCTVLKNLSVPLHLWNCIIASPEKYSRLLVYCLIFKNTTSLSRYAYILSGSCCNVLVSLSAKFSVSLFWGTVRSVGVGDGGVAAIASCGRRLKVVNMSYCASITDESLHSLAQLRDLLLLELRACSQVTSVGISYIAASCKHLRELDVKRCTFVGDPGVLALSRGCRNLRQVLFALKCFYYVVKCSNVIHIFFR